jgi:N utilization substance protein B
VLNRRHIRIKVMQTIYAMHQKGSDNLEKEEKFLLSSIENINGFVFNNVVFSY